VSITNAYQHDPKAVELLQQLVVHPSDVARFTLRSGVLRKDGKIWIPANTDLQTSIIQNYMLVLWEGILAFQ
jgi:hypothetical protein